MNVPQNFTVVNIYDELATKIKETLQLDAECVKFLAEFRLDKHTPEDYGDLFQEGFASVKLPAAFIVCDGEGANVSMGGTCSDDIIAPCAVNVILSSTSEVDARYLIKGILACVEAVVRKQKDSSADFNGHGGISRGVAQNYAVREEGNVWYAFGTVTFQVYFVKSTL